MSRTLPLSGKRNEDDDSPNYLDALVTSVLVTNLKDLQKLNVDDEN